MSDRGVDSFELARGKERASPMRSALLLAALSALAAAPLAAAMYTADDGVLQPNAEQFKTQVLKR